MPNKHLLPLLVGLSVVLAACAPAAAPRGAQRQPEGDQAAPSVRKSIVFGIRGHLDAFSLAEVGSGAPGRAMAELWLQGLVTSGMKTQAPEPRIAAEMPSLERGTMRINDDGTMTVTWRIRSDVKWADEVPFTSQDFLFGHHVATDRETPFPSGTLGRELASISAPDDLTLVMVWRRPYYLANAIGSPVAGLQPLPRHILQAEYESNNPDRFKVLPYWTTEFFHVGPFRPSRMTPGVEIVLDAVPHYFLGKPKLDSIVVKIFGDVNTLYAALQAKQIDITGNLSSELGLELKDQWERTGEGKVYEGVGTSSGIFFQFAAHQTEPALLDRRVRQALFFAIDRESWVDAVMGRKTKLLADGLLPYVHHLYRYTKGSLAMYSYDPPQAVRRLAEAGWTRGSDGFVTHNADGRRFKVLVWSGEAQANQAAILADMWKNVGLDNSIYTMPAALQENREHWQSYPNLEVVPRGYGDTILTRFECAEGTVAPTWRGANRGHYCDRESMDPLIDLYRGSLTMEDQGRYMKQIAEYAALDLPAIQTHFNPFLPAVVKGVTALADDFEGALEAGGRYGSYYRNGHLWDRLYP